MQQKCLAGETIASEFVMNLKQLSNRQTDVLPNHQLLLSNITLLLMAYELLYVGRTMSNESLAHHYEYVINFFICLCLHMASGKQQHDNINSCIDGQHIMNGFCCLAWHRFTSIWFGLVKAPQFNIIM